MYRYLKELDRKIYVAFKRIMLLILVLSVFKVLLPPPGYFDHSENRGHEEDPYEYLKQ